MFIQLITELLQGGFAVKFKACGRSMQPTIHEGETITVEPTDPANVHEGDIILYCRNDRIIAHRVVRIVKFTQQAVETSRLELPYEIADLKHSELVLNAESGMCHVEPHDQQLACSARSVDQIEFQNRQTESTEETSPSAQTSLFSLQRYYILRGDAATSCDDPVQPEQVLGKVVCVQRNGNRIDLCSRKSKWKTVMRSWAAGVKRKVWRQNAQTNLCN